MPPIRTNGKGPHCMSPPVRTLQTSPFSVSESPSYVPQSPNPIGELPTYVSTSPTHTRIRGSSNVLSRLDARPFHFNKPPVAENRKPFVTQPKTYKRQSPGSDSGLESDTDDEAPKRVAKEKSDVRKMYEALHLPMPVRTKPQDTSMEEVLEEMSKADSSKTSSTIPSHVHTMRLSFRPACPSPAAENNAASGIGHWPQPLSSGFSSEDAELLRMAEPDVDEMDVAEDDDENTDETDDESDGWGDPETQFAPYTDSLGEESGQVVRRYAFNGSASFFNNASSTRKAFLMKKREGSELEME